MNTQTATPKPLYNGWKNRQTWNVALWIGNDEGLYRAACHYMREEYADLKRELEGTPYGYVLQVYKRRPAR